MNKFVRWLRGERYFHEMDPNYDPPSTSLNPHVEIDLEKIVAFIEEVANLQLQPWQRDVLKKVYSNGWGSTDVGRAWPTEGGSTKEFTMDNSKARFNPSDGEYFGWFREKDMMSVEDALKLVAEPLSDESQQKIHQGYMKAVDPELGQEYDKRPPRAVEFDPDWILPKEVARVRLLQMKIYKGCLYLLVKETAAEVVGIGLGASRDAKEWTISLPGIISAGREAFYKAGSEEH